tara:strand:- start:20019 stop:21581 length:1563 start_codon:yes stop_codon:yes gene_type:complete
MGEIFKFSLPMRNLYDDTAGGAGARNGDDRMTGVYDSTAISSTVAFANRIQSDLMPPFAQWVELQPGPFVPENFLHEVQLRLQDATRKGFALVHASNFDLQINEFLLELAAGTAVLLVHESDDRDTPIRFEAVPSATVAFDEGPDGTVDGKFRKYKVRGRNVERTWPDADIEKLPDGDKEKITNEEKSEEEVSLEEVTYYDRDDKVWRYEVICQSSQGRSKEVTRIVERVYQTDPWIVGRWIKVAGESQGRGPLHFALPDIKTANAVVALILQNASFAVSGAFVGADDGVLNPATVTVRPGSVIAAKRPENLVPLQWGGRFDVGQLVLEDMRAQIKRYLFDERLPPMDASVRSATEIVQRIKQLQADIGAPFGRLMSEVVRPLWTRLLDIMHRKGLIDFPIRINGLTVSINVTSPLAQQQSMKEMEVAMLWLQLLQQLGPETLMLNAAVEDMGEWLADKLKVDRRLVRSKEQRVAIQQGMGQMMGQQIGQQMAGQAPQPQPGGAVQPGAPQGAAPIQLAA